MKFWIVLLYLLLMTFLNNAFGQFHKMILDHTALNSEVNAVDINNDGINEIVTPEVALYDLSEELEMVFRQSIGPSLEDFNVIKTPNGTLLIGRDSRKLNQYYINNSGEIGDKEILLEDSRAIYFEDVDQDSYLDIISTKLGTSVTLEISILLFNSDTYSFDQDIITEIEVSEIDFFDIRDICISDINLDGNQDILVATKYDSHWLEVNENIEIINYKGLIAKLSGIVNGIDKIYSQDFVNDGISDVYLLDSKNNSYISMRNIDGEFNSPSIHFQNISEEKAYFEDIDNNGFVDIIVARYDYSIPGNGPKLQVVAVLNYGNNTFGQPVVLFSDFSNNDLKFQDLNLDGQLDLIISTFFEVYFLTDINNFLQNPSTPVTKIHDLTRPVEKVISADINNDGKLDIIAFGTKPWFNIYENIGSSNDPIYSQRNSNFLPYDDFGTPGISVAFGELKEHWSNELIYAYQSEIYMMEIFSDFSTSQPIKIADNSSNKIEIADIDLDGRSDIVTGGHYLKNLSWAGSGFEIKEINNSSQFQNGVEYQLFDLENDGDLDLVIRGLTSIGKYVNKGDGTFEDYCGVENWNIESIKTLDINNDNKFDFFYLDDDVLYLALNKGDDFLPIYIYDLDEIWNSSYDFTTTDLDSDGLIDIVCYRKGGVNGEFFWFRNSGFNLQFDDPINLNAAIGSYGIINPTFEDLDFDGDQDMLFADRNANSSVNVSWCENIFNGSKLEVEVYLDENENGIKDLSEVNLIDQEIRINPSDNSYFANSDGIISSFLLEGEYEVKWVEKDNWELTSSESSYQFSLGDSETVIKRKFGVKPKIDNVNVEIFQVIGNTRCNTQSSIWLSYQNTGSSIVSGNLIFQSDNLLEIVELYPEPELLSAQEYVWSINDLKPSERANVSLAADLPNENFAGENLHIKSEFEVIESTAFHDSIFNFQHEFSGIVRCSVDPNDKLVNPQNDNEQNFTQFGEELYYTIRFQNTGNDYAETVVIRDKLDASLDWDSFRPISSSHSYELEKTSSGNIEWRFNDINLPDSTSNEALSQGFVSFAIKPMDNLSENTEIYNSAEIYFDYNAPIITNETINTMVSEVLDSMGTQSSKAIFTCYPIPFSDILKIENETFRSDVEYRVNIYNNLGSLIGSQILSLELTTFATSAFPIGLYYYEIIDLNQMLKVANGKLIKV